MHDIPSVIPKLLLATASGHANILYQWTLSIINQTVSLKLSPGFQSGPDHQCRLFQTFA